ncbi:3-oxoacyl-[acyl-carrier-protein] synthase III C-terminal domain-containing protein [Micromonospora rifamycinica]|uniref:3-oxoacyl-[acyl-carrier-protein] synthase III C-terminal domain-containing protein n=1 Tax=Micromonospora rifamycinica TaxID=291594 RepID=UPI0034013750
MQVRFFSLSCLLFLAYPVGAISRTSIWLLPVLLAFATGYCRVIIRNTPQMHGNRAPLTVLVTLALGALMIPTLHYDWFSGLGVFAAIMLLINFPLRWWPAILTALIGSCTLIAQFMLHAERNSIVVLLALLVIVGATQVAVYKQIETSDPATTTYEWGLDYAHMGNCDQFAGINHLYETGRLKSGDRLVTIGAGIGFMWTAAVIEIV